MANYSHSNFTELLLLAQDGDLDAENLLFELIEQDLRDVAARLSRGVEVSGTSIVNEAYVYFFRRIKIGKDLDLKNRRYFFSAVADRMRKIILDRKKKRRPGPWNSALDDYLEDFRAATNWEFESLHSVLTEFLNSEDPKQRRRHQLINLHFFAGMTYKAAAAELGISTSQYQIDRARALAELQQAISTREL